MTSWEFAAAEPIEAKIGLPAGSVSLAATQSGAVTVTLDGSGHNAESLIADTEVSFENGTLTVEVPKRSLLRGNTSLDLIVELPAGSSVSFRTASADVVCEGELGSLTGRTASGDVVVERLTGTADIGTASGDIRLTETAGPVKCQTASGDTVVGRAGGPVTANTASGDITVEEAVESAILKTASGDLRISGMASGRADATSVSGDISVAVPSGIGVYLDLSTISGHVSSALDASQDGGDTGAALTLNCRSVSGDIRITRAA